MMKKLIALIISFVLVITLAACGTGTGEVPEDPDPANSGTENPGSAEMTDPPESDEPDAPTEGNTVEAPGSGPADASDITSVGGVPLITLNNGVQMPQFGLGTQIQSLENGDLGVLNQTSREAVAAALRSGYRHLDDAHGYLQERGVGQGIIDSGVPREEIWITDKLWPSEYGNASIRGLPRHSTWQGAATAALRNQKGIVSPSDSEMEPAAYRGGGHLA